MRPTAFRRLGLTTAVVLAAVWSYETPVGACTCMQPGPPCDATWRASAVFVGEASEPVLTDTGTGVEYHAGRRLVSNPIRVRFKILEAFRGVTGLVVDVYTNENSAACGFAFSANRTYLVYAYEHNGRFTANICSRTKLASAAGEDLAYLRGAARSGVDMSRIEGEVRRYADVPHEYQSRPFANARVRLQLIDAPGVPAVETRSGPDGRYSIRVPPGRYTATLDVPEGLYVWPEAPIIHLLDARGCREADFGVRANGRISGRVLNARGDPVPYFGVEIMTAREHTSPFFSADARVVTDADGRYEFARLLSDAYVVGHDVRQERDKSTAVTWLLNEAGTGPAQIAVPPGVRVTAPDFRLPKSLALVEVTGRLLDENGQPVAGAEIYFDPGTCCSRESAVRTADDGTFRMTAIAGRRYVVLASVWRGTPPTSSVRSEPFVAEPGLPRLELRLNR